MGGLPDAFFGIFEGLIMLSTVEVGSRPIGVEDVVVGVVLDGLAEHFDGLPPVLLLEGGVALGLVVGGFLQIAHQKI